MTRNVRLIVLPLESPAWSTERRRDLSEVELDAERRDRYIEIARWNRAPAAYGTRQECDANANPCPAVRCIHHLGDRGDGTFTCMRDFVRNAPRTEIHADDAQRTGVVSTARIAATLGVTQQQIDADFQRACHKIESLAPDVLKALGIRRRHA